MLRLFRDAKNYAPADTTGGNTGVIEDKSMSKEDVIKFLGEDDVDEKDKEEPLDLKESKEKKAKEDKTEEDDKEESLEEGEEDELSELEDELEEPTEEQLELTTPVARREILKKYPQLFKDFPYLERAYYREQQYTELLPTLDDARAAVEKSTALDNFEKEVLDGRTETILKAIKESNQSSFNKLVDDYLPTLARVDEKAYHHVIGNTVKHTIIAMVQEARTSNNEKLQEAAQILNQFVFGSSNFQPIQKLSIDGQEAQVKNEKEEQLNQRERAIVQKQFDSARSDLTNRVNNILKSTIDVNIDPKDSMSSYVKKYASQEVLTELDGLIGKDSRFKVIMDKLWERAFQDGFTQVSTDRIRSAYLSKARTLLPSVIKKARNEALKGMGKKVSSEKESVSVRRGGKSQKDEEDNESPRASTPNKIPKGMRTIDYLMQD